MSHDDISAISKGQGHFRNFLHLALIEARRPCRCSKKHAPDLKFSECGFMVGFKGKE
jgi:hypothetical protein